MIQSIGKIKVEIYNPHQDPLMSSIFLSSFAARDPIHIPILLTYKNTSVPAILSPVKHEKYYLHSLGGFIDQLTPILISEDARSPTNHLEDLYIIIEEILKSDLIKFSDLYVNHKIDESNPPSNYAYSNILDISDLHNFNEYVNCYFPTSKKKLNHVSNIIKKHTITMKPLYDNPIDEIEKYYARYSFESNWCNKIYYNNLFDYLNHYIVSSNAVEIKVYDDEDPNLTGNLIFVKRLDNKYQIPIMYGDVDCCKAAILAHIQIMFNNNIKISDFLVSGDEIKNRYGFNKVSLFHISKNIIK